MTSPPFRRAIVIVLDSVGIGELPDAATYGDQGSDTLGNIAKSSIMSLASPPPKKWRNQRTSMTAQAGRNSGWPW